MSTLWMPWYIGDYLKDTQHLSTVQHGAYLLLIGHYWQHGGLPQDEGQLRLITRMTARQWRQNKDLLRSLFGDHWRSKRVDLERTKQAEISSKRKAAALQKQSKCSANAQQMHTQSQSQSHKKEREDKNPPSAVPPPGNSLGEERKRLAGKEYAFECGVIKLNQKDFDQWKRAYEFLSLEAELIALGKTDWLASQKNWFMPLSALLAKKNGEARARIEGEKARAANGNKFVWRSGIEGVI